MCCNVVMVLVLNLLLLEGLQLLNCVVSLLVRRRTLLMECGKFYSSVLGNAAADYKQSVRGSISRRLRAAAASRGPIERAENV